VLRFFSSQNKTGFHAAHKINGLDCRSLIHDNAVFISAHAQGVHKVLIYLESVFYRRKCVTQKIKIAPKVPLIVLVPLSVLVSKIAAEVISQKHQFTKVVRVLTEILSFKFLKICQFLKKLAVSAKCNFSCEFGFTI
jgi:hypothetical protein